LFTLIHWEVFYAGGFADVRRAIVMGYEKKGTVASHSARGKVKMAGWKDGGQGKFPLAAGITCSEECGTNFR
jgi:hypothetical protein